MADGDYRTHWTARDWWYNEHVVVTFREPQDLQAAIWVPRLDGNHAAAGGNPGGAAAAHVVSGHDVQVVGHAVGQAREGGPCSGQGLPQGNV